ncbi:hypothetical protein Lal_00019026 [Lupinus albus]|uniref:Uncharacterized protein n=1 Tax=Lupinus albus TaxID=3870 RepID=A0A6A5PLQ8_LUPAL|nr:hypothetical protein Lalb_Chr01g0004051 [Lupinus albus]KAF1898905.1 hypothetical protein Lal_00019026 [Lupinus albus]
MAKISSSTAQKEKTNLPPKRGQIKAQIFSSFVKFVTSKGGKVTEKNGNNNNSGGSASSSSTPPPSDYNSDVSLS